MSNRVEEWVKTLSYDKQQELLVECIEELINTETVCFSKNNIAPYWDATGDILDGSIENNWIDGDE